MDSSGLPPRHRSAHGRGPGQPRARDGAAPADRVPPAVWSLAIENSPDGMLIVDSHGCVQYANPAARSLLGRPVEELVGQPFGIPVGGASRTEIEIPVKGERHVCEMLVAATNLTGEEAFLVSLRDVTRRRQIAEEWERVVREAEAAARAKDAVISTVAHELRAPLAVVRGYLSLMASGDLGDVPPAWREALVQVSENADQLRLMVEQMLTSARLEAGRVQSGRERVDLREIARRAVNRAAGRAALASAHLSLDICPVPVLVEIQPDQVGTILDNLVNNAIKYSDGEPWVEVRVGMTGGRAEVRVRDNGLGIAPELQQAVFERFRRLPNSGDKGRPGTGLGLAIARDMTELNGGTLTVERSQPGSGSCFLLTLPIAAAEAGETPRQDG